MTTESAILAELKPLLDALCEDSITGEQLARLETLVLAFPEAEQHYVRFMSFNADLIGAIAGLPEPTLPVTNGDKPMETLVEMPSMQASESVPPAAAATTAFVGTPMEPIAVPSSLHAAPPSPNRKAWRGAWKIAISLLPVLLIAGSVGAYQLRLWNAEKQEVANAQQAVDDAREKLAMAKADQTKSGLDFAAIDAEPMKLAQEYQAALEKARKAIAEKDCLVRVTGPMHFEPGAPNKWQIETVRQSGSIVRAKEMEIAVKDDHDVTLLRETRVNTVGSTTLELPAAFWSKVKPGANLFLEVSASTAGHDRPALADRFPLARPVYVTHLATDKPLYQPGETIRYRSLTLDRSTLRPPTHDLRLKFQLRKPDGAIVELNEGNGRLLAGSQPVVSADGKQIRGIGVGESLLPADSPGGEYQLELTEVEAGKSVLIETRKFIVNRYVPDTFEKKLEFDGKSYGTGDVVQARIEVSRTSGGPMKNARAVVVASLEGRTLHEERTQNFTIVGEGANAKIVLNVRFKLPADLFAKNDAPSATLGVTILDGSDAEAIVRPVPLVTKALVVDFYPEGGDMIEGLTGRVYFQVRTPRGKPADVKGYITDGTNTVAEIATLTDAEHPGVNRGQGVFALTPRAGAKYFLKLRSPTGIKEPTPSGFPLPIAKAEGVSLTALDAVTPRGGPVRVRVQVRSDNAGPKAYHVGAYARGRLIGQERVMVKPGEGAEVSLPGDPAAGGVVRITVFEEIANENRQVVLVPRAERLAYRVPGEQLVLSVKPDRERYTPGGIVKLEISAANERKEPAPAILMVGVVNRSVITMADNKTDRLLPTHFLLSGEVSHPAELEHADFLLTDHPKAGLALDLLLGTQGWRRFAEQTGAAELQVHKKEVGEMLIAHGQEPSAPVELRKLEEQRLAAEYQPKIEAAAFKSAEAQRKVVEEHAKRNAAIEAAQGAVRAAERHYETAEKQVEEFVTQLYSRVGLGLLTAFLAAGLAIFIATLSLRSGLSTLKKGRLGVMIVPTCFAIAILLIVLFKEILVTKHAVTEGAPRAWPLDLPLPSRGADPTNAPHVAENAKKPAADPAAVKDKLGQPNAAETPEDPFIKADGNAVGAPAPVPMDPSKPVAPSHAEPNRGGHMRPALPPYQPQGNWANPAPVQPGMPPMPPMPNMGMNGGMMGMAGGMMGMNGGMMGMPMAAGKVPPPRPLPGQGGGGFGGRGGLRPGMLPPANGQEARAEYLPPFIVREYAHQRNSDLGDVRSDFTETVFWHPVLVLPDSGKASVQFQLADDVARYQVLVAGHTVDGRIGAIATTIESRKPISVDPKLPLEISHTDRVDVPVRVTNDGNARRDVSVKVGPSELLSVDRRSDTIILDANRSGRRIFQLQAKGLEGQASVAVEALALPGADGDAIQRTIRVVPDGFPGVGSFSDVLEGKARAPIVLPKGMVAGSLRMKLEAYPTSMADLVKGLDGLLREPNGCFEQTSTSNYPNLLILDYLNQTNQNNPVAARRAKELLERGYARLMSFECPDTPQKVRQGFEWFGAADMQHEALTAYGLLQFKDLARVHPVDPELIKRTQAFLLSRRDGKGGFIQNQRALDHFGGAPKHTTDAYIVWALVESDPDNTEKLDLKKEIESLKAQALKEDSAGGKDAYFLALTANILLLRGDREAGCRILDRLQAKHLKEGAVTGAVTSITRSAGRDLEIETTALTLLGWLRTNDPTYAPAVKAATRWISQQRGGYGGFGSTQSTILALKALILVAKRSAHPAESGEFIVKASGKVIGTKKFTEKDLDVISLAIEKPEEVFKPGEKIEVEISTDGKRPYPFSLSYTFNTLTPMSSEKCAVRLAASLARAEAAEGETVPLTVTLENRQLNDQGMAVAIVGLPAGLKAPTDLKQLTDLREKGKVSYFELRGRELILYWRGLAPSQKSTLTIDLVADVPGRYRGPASRSYLYYAADDKHWVEPLAITVTPMGAGK